MRCTQECVVHCTWGMRCALHTEECAVHSDAKGTAHARVERTLHTDRWYVTWRALQRAGMRSGPACRRTRRHCAISRRGIAGCMADLGKGNGQQRSVSGRAGSRQAHGRRGAAHASVNRCRLPASCLRPVLILPAKRRVERKSRVHHGGTEARRRPTHAADAAEPGFFSVPPCLRASVVESASCRAPGSCAP